MYFLLQIGIFHFYVSLPEGNSTYKLLGAPLCSDIVDCSESNLHQLIW